jgi:hypothetical protein
MMDDEMKCLLLHASPIATPETPGKKDCRDTLPAECKYTARCRQVEEDDEMKAVRMLIVVSITHGRRFSSPSINHYKIPIQEEKAYVARDMVAQE